MTDFSWLELACLEFNQDSKCRQLGRATIEVGFRAGDHGLLVKFHGDSIASVQRIENRDAWAAIPLVITMSPRQWSFYLRRRRTKKESSLMVFNLRNRVLKFRNPLDHLHFQRVHLTIQALVDLAANLPISLDRSIN